MFTPNFYIDQFQLTKKIVADQIFKDQPELQAVAVKFLDTQTAFAKMLVDNSITVNKLLWDKATALPKPQ